VKKTQDGSGRSVYQVAQETGINPTTLKNWISQYKHDRSIFGVFTKLIIAFIILFTIVSHFRSYQKITKQSISFPARSVPLTYSLYDKYYYYNGLPQVPAFRIDASA